MVNERFALGGIVVVLLCVATSTLFPVMLTVYVPAFSIENVTEPLGTLHVSVSVLIAMAVDPE